MSKTARMSHYGACLARAVHTGGRGESRPSGRICAKKLVPPLRFAA